MDKCPLREQQHPEHVYGGTVWEYICVIDKRKCLDSETDCEHSQIRNHVQSYHQAQCRKLPTESELSNWFTDNIWGYVGHGVSSCYVKPDGLAQALIKYLSEYAAPKEEERQ